MMLTQSYKKNKYDASFLSKIKKINIICAQKKQSPSIFIERDRLFIMSVDGNYLLSASACLVSGASSP